MAALYKEGCKQQPGHQADMMRDFAKQFVWTDAMVKGLVDGIAKGHMDATVVQDPIKMGYLAVKTMVAHLAGKPVEKQIDTGATLITRETMGTPSAQALLNPDFKRWLKED